MDPSCLQCCFYETTRAAVLCSCILYTHLSVHAHITHARARIRARMRMHMHMTHSSAHAQTRMHPGTCGPTTHAHMHPRMNTRACMRTHTHYARTHARTCMHAPAQCTCMHTHAHARTHLHMRTHSCNHLQFGCALTDWGHTPQLWFVFGKTLSLFGCLALFVLHSHGHASSGNAGG